MSRALAHPFLEAVSTQVTVADPESVMNTLMGGRSKWDFNKMYLGRFGVNEVGGAKNFVVERRRFFEEPVLWAALGLGAIGGYFAGRR